MGKSSLRTGLTIVEMVIVSLIVAMLMGYVWKFYSSSTEINRHTYSQSQLQTDTRLFFDQFARDVASSYRFCEMDYETHKMAFYVFQDVMTPSDTILYNGATLRLKEDHSIVVSRVEYSWDSESKKVVRKQVPGKLAITKKPAMTFTEDSSNAAPEDAPKERVYLTNIQQFDFRAYQVVLDFKAGSSDPLYKVTPIESKDQASATTFVTLRVHNKIDEAGSRRDEELDVVSKFYSRVRLAEATYPGYFSMVDEDGSF